MKNIKGDIVNTTQACKFMLRAFLAAHQKIVGGVDEDHLYSVGTSTMIAGMVMELAKPDKEGKWVFVFVSVGDCKAYLWSKKLGKAVDLTQGNRQNISDVRDPGGRLGPQLSKGAPDLRNLSVYSAICDDNDIILMVSDGVHDNLDPQYAGKTPSEFDLLSKDDTWGTVIDEKKASDVKSQWTYDILDPMFNNAKTGEEALKTIVSGLIKLATERSSSGREFMEKYPEKRLPDDFKLYPGKMDHATALVFRVGKKSAAQPQRSVSGRTVSL
jgi:serine/threonine protein phosphatase PrpC